MTFSGTLNSPLFTSPSSCGLATSPPPATDPAPDMPRWARGSWPRRWHARPRDRDHRDLDRLMRPGAAARERLRALLDTRRYDELRDALTRAELADELTELDVLTLRASLAIAERSDSARDYLEMAEAVAATPEDRAMVAEHRAAHDLATGDLRGAADRCVAALDHGHQTEGLWIKLLLALDGLGEVATIDAVLDGLGRLGRAATDRLAALVSAEPGLAEVMARAACRSRLDGRVPQVEMPANDAVGERD
jgi:hypothetical protein